MAACDESRFKRIHTIIEALLPDNLRRVRIVGVDSPHLEWAIDRHVSLPATLIASITGSAESSDVDLRGCAPPPDGLLSDLRLGAAFTAAPPHARRLPFSYQRVPPSIRAFIGRQLGRRLRARQSEWARFPAWPLDLSADFVSDWMSAAPAPPAHRRTPVVLTHDIDSPEGLANLVAHFLPLEERFGATSTNYIVPCAWPIDHGVLGEIVGRGHSLGVHGYDHSNRTPHLPAPERRQRLSAARTRLERYGPLGYRAPSLVRTAPLLQDLAEFFAYDSSIPTSGGPFPVFNNGCATARPFRVGATIEIPISLLRDGSLRFLGHSGPDISRMWIEAAESIAAARGTVVLLTHCEHRFSGNPEMLEAYRCFLEHVASSPGFEFTTARHVGESVAA